MLLAFILRAVVNLGFAKPMFCIPVHFTKMTGTTKTTTTAWTATNKGVDARLAEMRDTTEMAMTHGNPGCKTQIFKGLGLEKPECGSLLHRGEWSVSECTKSSHSQSLVNFVANFHSQGISAARTKFRNFIRKTIHRFGG